MTLRVGLTHPALAQELKLTWMDYLLTMLRNRLRRKHSYDTLEAASSCQRLRRCAAPAHLAYRVTPNRIVSIVPYARTCAL